MVQNINLRILAAKVKI